MKMLQAAATCSSRSHLLQGILHFNGPGSGLCPELVSLPASPDGLFAELLMLWHLCASTRREDEVATCKFLLDLAAESQWYRLELSQAQTVILQQRYHRYRP